MRKKHTLNLGNIHNEFLQLLSTFYTTHRYGRYSLSSALESGKEKSALQEFIKKHLKIELANEDIVATSNDEQIRKFIGRTTGKIANQVYEIIRTEAGRLSLTTKSLQPPNDETPR